MKCRDVRPKLALYRFVRVPQPAAAVPLTRANTCTASRCAEAPSSVLATY